MFEIILNDNYNNNNNVNISEYIENSEITLDFPSSNDINIIKKNWKSIININNSNGGNENGWEFREWRRTRINNE